jgi:hypothetical protein
MQKSLFENIPMSDVNCWSCQYCDKESVLKVSRWVLTRTGYCLAEKSAVNGENDFYKKVYVNTIYKQCGQFEPCSQRYRAWRRWACRMLKFSRMCLPTFAKPVL